MNHLLNEKSRKLELQNRTFVQNGVGTDYILVQLEDGGAFDGCDTVLLTMTRAHMQPVAVRLDGEPVEVPASLMESTGALWFSLTGYVGDEVRATTVLMKPSKCGIVVESGTVSGGEVPPKDAAPDLWKQLMDEVDAATDGAVETLEKAEHAASAASTAAGQAQSAQAAAETAASTATRAASDAQDALGQLNTQVSDAREYAQAAHAARTAAETAKDQAETAAATATDQASAAQAAAASAQSAQVEAEGAASTAQAKAEAAEGAASSATEASARATESASSATSAASSATENASSAREAAQAAAQAAESAENAAQSATAVLGNVPKKTVTDLVAHGEDAYAQKPLEVRVKGKTWVNRWPEFPETQTTNGVTLTCDETGLFTISGTASSFVRFAATPQGIGQNKDVAILLSAPLGDGATAVLFSGKSAVITSASDTAPHKGNTGSFETITAAIQVTSGSTVNASFRVMLVDGTEAPDCFTPPASIASVETGKLVTAGKNLLKGDYQKSESNYYYPANLPSNAQLCIKNIATGQAFFGVASEVGGEPEQVSSAVVNPQSTATFTLTSEQAKNGYLVVYNTGFDLNIAAGGQWQLELGSTATPYEPPTVTETPLPEVELRSLPNGTCDELVIRADGTCEVERRTGSYTATGNEDVVFANDQAYFHPTPVISNLTWRERISCDKLPAVPTTENILGCSKGYDNRIFFMVPGAITDVETAKQWLATNKPTFVYDLDEHTTEDQADVTLPTLPAPTFNQYHDSAVPSDTSTEYARDINIVLANLESVQAAILGGE